MSMLHDAQRPIVPQGRDFVRSNVYKYIASIQQYRSIFIKPSTTTLTINLVVVNYIKIHKLLGIFNQIVPKFILNFRRIESKQ